MDTPPHPTLRIGLVSAEFPPAIGGVGDHTARLARELATRGHQVDVLTSAGLAPTSPPRTGRETEEASPAFEAAAATTSTYVEVLRQISRWDWRILRTVPAIARARRWDVLHIQYQPAAYHLHGAINLLPLALRAGAAVHAGARKRARPALVTTFHDLRVPYLFPKAGPLRRQAVRALAAGSDASIAVAEEDLPHLWAWTGDDSAGPCARHVPLGNQLDAPPPAGFTPGAWRAQAGLPAGASLVGYLGFVNHSKGVAELIRALAGLSTATPPTRPGTEREPHLVMIGEQLGSSDVTNRAYLQAVRHLIEAHRLESRVHWTGYLDPAQISAWLRTVDVVALPFTGGASLRRTSLLAAWWHGVPVVTTRPQGDGAWSSDGGAPAVFVEQPDPVLLADAIRRVLHDDALRAALRRTGQAFARRFAWPAVTRATLEVYRFAGAQAAGAPPQPHLVR